MRLEEKWIKLSDNRNIWFSSSISEFRQFLKNISTSGIHGLRLCIKPYNYIAGIAYDFNHDMLVEECKKAYLIDTRNGFEFSAVASPKHNWFDVDNYSIDLEGDEDIDEFFETDFAGTLCADCGDFEVILNNFNSKDLDDSLYGSDLMDIQDSHTWEVIKPLCKALYIVPELNYQDD